MLQRKFFSWMEELSNSSPEQLSPTTQQLFLPSLNSRSCQASSELWRFQPYGLKIQELLARNIPSQPLEISLPSPGTSFLGRPMDIASCLAFHYIHNTVSAFRAASGHGPRSLIAATKVDSSEISVQMMHVIPWSGPNFRCA